MNLKNKSFCRILCGCALCLLLVGMIPLSASATTAYPSYTYNSREMAVPTAMPYEAVSMHNLTDIGLGNAAIRPELSDMFVAENGEVYILDKMNACIIKLDSDLKPVPVNQNQVVTEDGETTDGLAENVIQLKDENGEPLTVNDAYGLYVHNDGRIVVCCKIGFGKDTGAVCVFDSNGVRQTTIGRPDSPVIPDEFDYRPIKAEIDSGGILYVLSANSYNGAMQFDKDYKFMGFYGSEDVDVSFDVLWDYFWKNLMDSGESLGRQVPVEFVSFCIDPKNFVFTIRRGGDTATGQVRKLNAKGENVLEETKRFGDHVEKVVLEDIVVDDEGFITIIDSSTGRIMQYDPDGEMLYAFAGQGTQMGTFSTVAAIESINGKLLAMDKDRGIITVFEPTDFALKVREATLLYRDGKYDDAKDLWLKVLTYDNNYELANVGMGKIYEGLGEFEVAMDYYKKGNNKGFYSEAFEDFRGELLRKYFIVVMLVIVGVIAGLMYLINKKPTATEVYAGGRAKHKYPLYCMLHPINGYDDLKAEKSGSFWLATAIIGALFVVSILAHQLTGFAFNPKRVDQLNIWVSLCSTVGVFVAFVVCNWAVTTIMDGKGKMGEIWVFCAYALLPYVLVSAILIICSNVLVLDENAFYVAIQWIGYGWTAICMVIALREVHQYTLGKTFATIAITFCGLMIVVVVVAIVYSVFSQLIGFISTLWSEISMRI